MEHKVFIGKARKYFIVLSSLFLSVALGSMTTLAATNPDLHVAVFPIANGGLPVTAGGALTYFYQIWNTGTTPISNIVVSDSACSPVIYDGVGEDLNANHMLDNGELWSYYCTIRPTSTVTNTFSATGNLNGAPVTTTTNTTVVVPPAPAGSNLPGTSSDNTGANGSNSGYSNGTSGKIPQGMPDTGLGGAATMTNTRKQVKSKTQPQLKVSANKVSSQNSATPVKLKIPSEGISANIESLGLTANGDMKAPANATDAGWYQFGTVPGQIGNAVIAGHLDTYTSDNGVFWNLNKLQAGDDIYVVNAQNQTLHFKVTSTQTYNYNNAPIQSIFGSSAGSHLNLITCAGTWNSQKQEYSNRFVVYTDLVQ